METATLTRDLAPGVETFLQDVLTGLGRFPKELPCKYFYDERGSQLFEQICELEEYYPTRTELSIMNQHADAMAESLGRRCVIVEFGSGSGLKTELLLDSLEDPVAYVPIDISGVALEESAARLARRFPALRVLPVHADYTEGWRLPKLPMAAVRRVVYFPGSTIGNFDREHAIAFLRRARELVGVGGGLLIGVDLKKDRDRLERAYDDASGVTAAFNLNLLHRINQELGADFDLRAFRHRASYNEEAGRVEMFLESRRAQTVTLAGAEISFRKGERICTEHSYKYDLEEFGEMASEAGFRVDRLWTDPEGLFSVQLLVGESPVETRSVGGGAGRAG